MSHSAQVALALEIRGESFPLASVGPTEMKLRDPSPAWWTIDVGDWAELVSVVDGLETRQEIRVPASTAIAVS